MMIRKLSETTLTVFFIALSCTIACLPAPEGSDLKPTNTNSTESEELKNQSIEIETEKGLPSK